MTDPLVVQFFIQLYDPLWPYRFTLKLFTFSWLIEKYVCIFVDKIDNQLKIL